MNRVRAWIASLVLPLASLSAFGCGHECSQTEDATPPPSMQIVYAPSEQRVADYVAASPGASADSLSQTTAYGDRDLGTTSFAAFDMPCPGSPASDCTSVTFEPPRFLLTVEEGEFDQDPGKIVKKMDGYESRIFLELPTVPSSRALSDVHALYCEVPPSKTNPDDAPPPIDPSTCVAIAGTYEEGPPHSVSCVDAPEDDCVAVSIQFDIASSPAPTSRTGEVTGHVEIERVRETSTYTCGGALEGMKGPMD